jgi:hypothetical protein
VWIIMFRILRVRFRAEWPLMLAALLLVLLYPWFCSSSVRDGTNLYSYAQFEYYHMANLGSMNELSGVAKSDVDPWLIAQAYKLDPRELPEDATLLDVYNAVVRQRAGYLFENSLWDGVLFGFPILDGLAMLLLCPLFRRRRLGQFLAVGYSRRQVWLSFTLLYFSCTLVMWLLALLYLTRFHIPFQAAMLAWLLYLLFIAAIPYLAALFLPRPAAAFFAALGVWIALLLIVRRLNGSTGLIAALIAVVAAALIAGVVLSWTHFRKRRLGS